jgi:myo-inositol catabolism protein IolC
VTYVIDWSQKELLILAFDHRASFLEKMFGIKGRQPTPEEKKQIVDYKKMIFEGFLLATKKTVPKEIAGLLVDEEYGADVLREAKKEGLMFALPVEKSGQDEFDFDYGDDFAKHIEEFDPTFVKVLVRYNSEGDAATNKRQLQRLKKLGDYLANKKRRFLFELIVPSTSVQLAKLGGSKEKYDQELRPKLMIDSIKEIQAAGIEPTIWKLEGVDKSESAKAIVKQAQSGGRKVGVITLGRGESKVKVQEWLKIGAKIPGIIGFAVGRTIFWEPLVDHKEGKTNRKVTVEKVAQNYQEFTELWLNERKGKQETKKYTL